MQASSPRATVDRHDVDGPAAGIAAIADSSTTLASATEHLSASARDMARLTDESAMQSTIVAGTAVQVSTNVQTVAAGSHQMGASIRQIAQNAGSSASPRSRSRVSSR